MKQCDWCDAEFTPHKMTPKGRQRFCSPRCRQQHCYYEGRARQSERAA